MMECDLRVRQSTSAKKSCGSASASRCIRYPHLSARQHHTRQWGRMGKTFIWGISH